MIELLDEIKPMRGVFEYRMKIKGTLVDEYREDNLIVDMARTTLSKLIGGDGNGKNITGIGFGTNPAMPTPADSALTAPYIKGFVSHNYPSPGRIQFVWTLTTTEANGLNIAEFGLLCADGSLFARKSRGVIAKDQDMSLDGSWTIIF